jgi:nicotinamide-nucleotide amidase
VTDVAELLDRLAGRGQTVAVAESLTGGELTATLTAVPGASRVVRGGLVVYATDTKTLLAGVDPQLLERVGPVDAGVARELAEGARAMLHATFGLGVTGVAGPDPQSGHPVGEVHVAVAGPLGLVGRVLDLEATTGRAEIRRQGCLAAVALLDAVSRETP